MKLAFVSTADYCLFPDIVGSFRRVVPDVHIMLREMMSDLQLEAVLEGNIDRGLVISGMVPPRVRFGCLPLLTEPLVAAVQTGRPIRSPLFGAKG